MKSEMAMPKIQSVQMLEALRLFQLIIAIHKLPKKERVVTEMLRGLRNGAQVKTMIFQRNLFIRAKRLFLIEIGRNKVNLRRRLELSKFSH